MSVERQANILGQQRLDVPHLRAIESSIAADFDLLAGRILAGGQALVVRGMALITSGAVGNPATSLQLQTANSVIMHSLASEHGTIFSVPADQAVEVLNSTNPIVSGSFTAGQINYVGLDLRRTADDTTADLVQFMDADSKLETPKTVPLARTLSYRIVISTAGFDSTPNLLPIAKVTTSSTNVVTAIADARALNFRLGSGGSVPNSTHAYPWSTGRAEITSGSVFSGGDKDILSTKDWMDAVMTRLWETGGGEHWYSPTADRNVNLVWIGAAFTNGENFEWTGTNLHWKGIRLIFDNSTGTFNNVTDQTGDAVGVTDLADGDCVYVDLARGSNATVTAAKAQLTTLGPGSLPGSRYVIAWRVGSSVYTRGWRYPVGTLFTPATTTSQGILKITRDYAGVDTSGASALNDPKALSDRGGTITTPLNTNVGLTIKRFDAGADMTRWQTSAGTTLTSINNNGDIVFATSNRKIGWTKMQVSEFVGSTSGLIWNSDVNAQLFTLNNTSTFASWLLQDNASSIAMIGAVDSAATKGYIGTLTGHPLVFQVGASDRWAVDFPNGDLVAQGAPRRIKSITDAATQETGSNAINVQSAYKLPRAYRNIVINGAMDYWQRGTSIAVPQSLVIGYTADRWGTQRIGGSSAATVTQQTDTPSNGTFKYGLRYQRTAANTDTNALSLAQEIDRNLLKTYMADTANAPATLSFWIKKGANFSGTLNVQIRTGDGAGTNAWLGGTGYTDDSSPLFQSLTGTITTSWQQIVIPAANLGNSGANPTSEAAVVFIWNPSGAAGANDWYEITGVMLTPQDRVNPTFFTLAGGDPASELLLCKRYYEKSYELTTAPGSAVEEGIFHSFTVAASINNQAIWLTQSPYFTVEKWISGGTVKLWTAAGVASTWQININEASIAGSALSGSPNGLANTKGFHVYNNTGGSVSVTQGYVTGHWTCDADFRT